MDDLARVVHNNSISRIVVAVENGRGLLPVHELVKLRTRGIPVEEAHTAISALTGRVWLDVVQPSWFLYSEGFHRSTLGAAIKRLSDIVLGITGLFLSAPIMAAVALAVRLDSNGPVIYRQRRVGLAGSTFEVLKVRSMYVNAEARGAQWAGVDDPRITRVGRFIRKYRLDELPQFVNVIRGEMSFVGPRPERPVFVDQLKEVIPYYDERHSVRPGLTGWAQVQYPYGATVEDAYRKHEYDLFYLKNMSTLFDCAILIQTIRIVLLGRGSR
jgi:sugar transferase (PEP-CTERM system associated)